MCLALRVLRMQIGSPAHLSSVPRFRRGLPEGTSLYLRQRDSSMNRPFGLIPPKAPVLGAANGKQPARQKPIYLQLWEDIQKPSNNLL